MTHDELMALRLEEFVIEAIKISDSPREFGKWRSPLWDFVRLMKARQELRRFDGYAAAKILDRLLTSVTPEAQPDPWEQHFGALANIYDPRAEFIDTWEKVKTPANSDALIVAWREVEQLLLRPTRVYSQHYRQFISLAGHLQRSRANQPVALPVERIAQLLGCDRKTVSRYLKFALKEELLIKTANCVPRQLAAEFRFQTEKFDWTTGEQVK